MRSCPICSSSDSSRRFVVRGHAILACRACGGYFLPDTSIPGTEVARSRHRGRYLRRAGTAETEPALTGYYDYEADLALHLRNFRENVRIVQRYARGDRLLDLGCASGHFLLAAAQAGFRVAGADLSEAAVEQVRARLGCPAWAGGLADLELDDRFDVVTMWETIEHVADPGPVLGKVRTWLAPDGVLVIGTGDNSSLASRAMGRRWWYLNPPDHVVYYNARALEIVLGRHGFRVEGWERIRAHWVSSRNVLMKLLRSLDVAPASALRWARRVPDVPLRIVHGSTIVAAARAR